MSNLALAYFAGLVDGEGCICIKRSRANSPTRSTTYVFSLTIEMADPRAIDEFTAHFGLHKTFSASRLRVKPHHRAMHVFHVGGPRGVAILKAVLPYLRCKREEAELAIEFYESTVAGHDHRFRGRNKTTVPIELLARRHDFYLRLQALKVRDYETMVLAMP